ncbi:Bro-N domain-containing protein [Lachnospiraceae bacterium 46-61]
MNELSVIQTQEILGKPFTVYGDFESPLFLAKEVAEWIEHSDVSTMIRNIDDDEKLTQTLFVSGQNREMWFLTEDGVYEVLMQSRKPIAKQFKKEVKKVLKSIRKYGIYVPQETLTQIINSPDMIIEMLTRLKGERDTRIQLEKEVKQKNEIIAAMENKCDNLNVTVSGVIQILIKR